MILVTGHMGYIGSLLWEKTGDIGIDLLAGENLLKCQLPDGVDVIYHLAAQSFVEKSWEDPILDEKNIAMTVRLLYKYPTAKFIYANSAAAKEPIMSPYGLSKKVSADYIKLLSENYVICTFPNIYGRNEKSVVDIFKNSSEVNIYGDGTQTRDYVHVDDIVEGLLKARFWLPGEYEMGSGIQTSVLDLAEGKSVTFLPPRREAKESVLRNDTPNWKALTRVKDYLND